MLVTLFNQYYFDLLKALKSAAKENKGPESSRVLKAIRASYATFDRESVRHLELFSESVGEDLFRVAGEKPCFVGIPFASVRGLVNKMAYHQYLSALLLCTICYRNKLDDGQVQEAFAFLRGMHKKPDDIAYPSEEVLEGFFKQCKEHQPVADADADADFPLKEIEDTMIGKLAKEIVTDLNLGSEDPQAMLSKLQTNEGIGQLISTVGNKIQTKLTTGELNQDALLQDAMKLAAKLPQMLPKELQGMLGGLGGLGGLAALAGQSGPSKKKLRRVAKGLKKKNSNAMATEHE